MFQQKIISRKELEADIQVNTSYGNILCYAYPFTGLKEYPSIFAYGVSNILRCNKIQKIQRISNYEMDIVGVVADRHGPVISLGNINLELDEPLPKDIKENDIICFNVKRLSYK